MELRLIRKHKKQAYTIGSLYVNGKWFSDTLEDTDRGLSDSMNADAVKSRKIYGETAIPTGTYEVKLTYSSKFALRPWGRKYGGKVPEILNVKGFTGVRMHPGNSAKDTLGCVLVGRNLEKGKVMQSQDYYCRLMDSYIVPASNKNEKITITIE